MKCARSSNANVPGPVFTGWRRPPALLPSLLAVVGASLIACGCVERREAPESSQVAATTEGKPPEGAPLADGTPPESARRAPRKQPSPENVEAQRAQVAAFCGDCHAVPHPASFPKAAWYEEVQRGFDFYAASGRHDLTVPGFQTVVNYFQKDASEEITLAPLPEEATPSPVAFETTRAFLGEMPDNVFVSALQWSTPAGGTPEPFVCDMRMNRLAITRPDPAESVLQPVATVLSPAHATPVDLDVDGQLDLVVSELGRFPPEDHSEGRITWLRRTSDRQFEPIVLQAGMGRVADVQPADFDGDGDLDLVVAEFGWHSTGSISLLENRAGSGERPQFELRKIDSRHGTIHVPVADLNGDGRPDFVAAISQEHETVEIFFSNGAGGFDRRKIFDAEDPSFGTSGIQLVDLDQDGDLDVLHTNGDTFDSFYLKPNHGIRWLENRGDGTFERHELTPMAGVHRALAGDLDGDGDLDIVACALFPRVLKGVPPASGFASILWLEQTAPGEFVRHTIERENCRHAALELGDFDDDGCLDIAVAGFGETPKEPALTIWWNRGKSGATPAGPLEQVDKIRRSTNR